MKYICLGILLALLGASGVTMMLAPDTQHDVPILYWVTDPNPARKVQLEIFQHWLKEHGYPRFEVRLDTANHDTNRTKMKIQSVSGVGGDLMDIGGGQNLRFFQSMGVLEDLTSTAPSLHFDASETYESAASEIMISGRQYAFPKNLSLPMLWVNMKTFQQYGMPAPPATWDFQTFENIGREFVRRANPKGQLQKVFFLHDKYGIMRYTMRRCLGLSMFNETLTACALDDPRYIRVLSLLYKWRHTDRLMPDDADVASFSTDTGFGGSALQLFHSGNYAMVVSGRHALIQLRQFGSLPLKVVYPPSEDFLNTVLGASCTAVYSGSPHKDLAMYFLAFLASEDYNRHIAVDADGIPPNPRHARTKAFLRPQRFPNEWDCHAIFDESAEQHAIGKIYSPFVLASTATRIEAGIYKGVMSGVYTPGEAARMTAEQINQEIRRTLQENQALKPLHEKLVQRQTQIERLRAEDKKVPLAWIENIFHRKYYAYKGWGR